MRNPDDAPETRPAILPGTLDLVILGTLAGGPEHGHGIVLAILARSRDVLLVDHGSLYPALQRLEKKNWIRASWGVSGNNRRARFYELTRAGRKQLDREIGEWRALSAAVDRLLAPALIAARS